MRNSRDWRDATLMLSFEEKGYFDELLNLIYIYDDHLPDNDDLICRAMPVYKRMHLRLRQRLIDVGLIEVRDRFYFNKKASSKIAKINEISEANRLKAQSRWAKSLKKKNNSSAVVKHRTMQPPIAVKAAVMLNQKSEGDSDALNSKTKIPKKKD